MLTGRLTSRKEVPNEMGNFFEFRLLGWVALEDARSLRQKKALQSLAGVADVVGELQRARTEPQDQPADADPLNEYDRMSLLCKGISGWYGPYYDETPLSPDAIAGLDAATAEWAAREIIGMHTQTAAEREAGLFRNGSGV